MSTPTVPVTVTLAAQDGTPYAGVTVRARLDINEVYQGFVISDQADAVTDAGGVAVLNCFPNAPSPTGLGTQGSTYRFWAAIPGGRSLNVEALVPNTACRLENILLTTDHPPSLTDAQLAVAQAQSSVTTAATSAAAAAGSATTASGQAGVATAQAGIATTQAGIATTQAGNAAASATSASDNAVLAQAWATQLTPEVVAGQGYGAKKYAQDASASAGAAAGSAVAAALSESQAAAIVLGNFLQSGTGAYPRTFTSKLREVQFTPEDFGAIGDGNSHPLSSRYATLAAAQVDYPHATALTDEIDWCAWRAAVQAIYDANLAASTSVNQNWGHGKITAVGQYIVNKTITVDLLKVEIEGKVAIRSGESAVKVGSWIKYNGPDGTVDAPVYIFDFLTRTELGAAPSGRLAQTRGIAARIRRLGFFGKGGSMSGAPSASGYVSGIRLRQAVFSTIEDCVFGGTLYDAVVMTGAQLFLTIKGNLFYGVHRDCISNMAYLGDFSTTIWIRDNEFGYAGRYGILLDLYGSVEAMPTIVNNSFEYTFNSYYVTNPGWFVHGAVCAVHLGGCGNVVFRDNRMEGITGITAGFIADLHLVSSTFATISDSTFRGVLFGTHRGSQPRNTAFSTFLTANGWCDVTDTRNYRVGTSSDFSGECDAVRLSHIYNVSPLYITDSRGLGTSGKHMFEQVSSLLQSFPITGDVLDLVTAKTRVVNNSIVWLGSTTGANSSTKNATTTATPIQSHDNQIAAADFKVRTSPFDSGAQEFEMFREFYLRFGNSGASWNGYKGWVLNRLASDMSAPANALDEPLFYATPKDSTGAAWGNGYYEVDVVRKRKIRYEFSAAPTSGTWSKGDLVYTNNPTAGGFVGWVCVTAGTPGTWKTFGAISP